MMKQAGFIFLVVLFSVSIVYGLDETHRCDVGNDGCNFVWDVVNNSNKSQKIDWPCNVTVYDGTYTEVWSVLSDVTNKWHNVSMPVGTTFSGDWYHAERICNGTISSFNFEVNTTLANVNATFENVTVSVDPASIWGYTLSNNYTAEQNLTESGNPLFAIAILLIALIFFYLAFEVDGEQFELLRIMFVFVGIYMIMIGLQAMVVMTSANAGLNSVVNTSLQITGYILVVMIFFLLIQIIKNVYDIMMNRKMKVMG